MKTIEKRMLCFECRVGHYDEIQKNYTANDSTGKEWTIEMVPHLTCDTCGDVCFNGKATKQIDEALRAQGFPFRKFTRKK